MAADAALVGGAAEQNFIMNLYHDVLQRVPSAPEVTSWVNGIGNQTLDVHERTKVATFFLNSQEHHIVEIKADYTRFLGRAGEATGIDSWAAAMAKGEGDLDVEMGFLSSAEYSALHKTDTDFVNAAFNDLLGRTPSASELSFFTNELKSMTRAQVAEQGVMSDTNVQKIVTDTVGAFVGRAPTHFELAYGQELIQGSNPESLNVATATLLGTGEYFNKKS
jgi:hypothetical protein